jgi:hypothetical protein
VRDLRVLSDVEFEYVCADLLSAELATHFERFQRAADGGVDLRASDANGTHIVQCKHYRRSSFSTLARDLANEVANVQREQPASYRVVTSQELTRRQKDQLYQLFNRWMPSPAFVLGAHDLDGLLTRHPPVERRYVKLWLVSGGVLEGMVHSATYERSSDLIGRVLRALPMYVEGSGLQRALDILDRHRVCVISGPPGIGKTTLAQVLLAQGIREGFEPIEVSHDIEEAWATIDPSVKQMFYYDDFLGRISLGERLSKNEDHRLASFVQKIAISESKRLILTTREYILQDARADYEELHRLDDDLKIVLELRNYSRLDRARILYNHLWHAELSPEDLESLVSERNYLSIVDHRNFNPRLVEMITRPPITTDERP